MSMKNRILSCFLCLGILISLSTTAIAVSDESTIENVFSASFLKQARNSDGAYAYAIEAKILEAYENEPQAFLDKMDGLDVDDFNFFKSALVSSVYYDGNWSTFKNFLTSISNTNDTAKAILEEAADFEARQLLWDEAYQAYLDQPLPEGLFSPEILTEAILAHKDAYIYDQEFCGYLREMYELDPVLFIQTIDTLSDTEVSQIAQQISWAQYLNLGDVSTVKSLAYGTPTSETNLTASAAALKQSFTAEINSFTNAAEIEANEIEIRSAEPAQIAANGVNIGAMRYSNVTSPPKELEINKPAVLTTKITGLSANTQYTVELQARHNSSTTNNLKATKTYTSNSSGTINASLSVTFSSPGEIWTTVKVYRGTSLTASRTGGATDKIYARWRITIPFQSNNFGTLSFYYASGTKAYSCLAYGQSEDGFHYSKHYGNTPPGDYYGWSFDPSNDRATYPEESYGEYNIIKMVGNDDPGYSNLYVDSDTDTSKPRSGIWIHGGRDQQGYTVTHGCVRIHDADILKITNYMDDWLDAGYHTRGRVSITR